MIFANKLLQFDIEESWFLFLVISTDCKLPTRVGLLKNRLHSKLDRVEQINPEGNVNYLS